MCSRLPLVPPALQNLKVHMAFQNSEVSSSAKCRSGIAESHMAVLFLVFEETPYCFLSSCTSLHSHQQCVRVLFPHILTNTITSYLLGTSHIDSVRWYLIVVLTCISLMISDLSIFSCARGPSACLWKNVYSGSLPIF